MEAFFLYFWHQKKDAIKASHNLLIIKEEIKVVKQYIRTIYNPYTSKFR